MLLLKGLRTAKSIANAEQVASCKDYSIEKKSEQIL